LLLQEAGQQLFHQLVKENASQAAGADGLDELEGALHARCRGLQRHGSIGVMFARASPDQRRSRRRHTISLRHEDVGALSVHQAARHVSDAGRQLRQIQLRQGSVR